MESVFRARVGALKHC